MAFENKVILVTGASRGIGGAAAAACHAQGAKVVLHASGPSDAATQMASSLGQEADDFLFADLGEKHSGIRLVERAIERHGRLDGVVNNAGIFTLSPLDGPIEDWDSGWQRGYDTNIKAQADICRTAIQHFRSRGADDKGIAGSIVNISSRAAQCGDLEHTAAYAAAKAALIAMTKSWAKALAPEGILLYSIAPGWVDTRMMPAGGPARQAAIDETPLGRAAAPEELGAMIAFLLSGACPSATAATFDINGASYVR